MLWIIQNNLYNEEGYVRFTEALERLGAEYMIVKPIPFTNQFLPADFDSWTEEVDDVEEPFIDDNQKVIVMGATSLTRIAKARGWTPGTYLTDSFDFEKWRDGFGKENLLNGESITARISEGFDVTNMSDQLFVRPVDDSKAFAGVVMSKYDFFDWVQSMSVIEEEEFQPLHKNTKIAVANWKHINAEYRLFVVRGKVVTASLYKQGNVVRYSDIVDNDVLWFAACMIRMWQPAPAFVIDIADTTDGFKVIEINNINSAGFYAADCQKIVAAIEDLERFDYDFKEGQQGIQLTSWQW